MRGGEGEGVHLRGGEIAAGGRDAIFPLGADGLHGDGIFGDAVADLGERLELLHADGIEIGEAPEAVPGFSVGDLLAVVGSGASENGDGLGALFLGDAGFDGELLGAIAALAVGVERADEAHGFAREADGGAEFHDGLVVGGGIAGVEEGVGEGLELGAGLGAGDVVLEGEEAGEDAHDVAVEDGERNAEGDAADGGGGVGADAGEREEFLVGAGHFGARVDGFGEGMEVAGAAVVAEAFPGFEDGGFGRGGEGGPGGE